MIFLSRMHNVDLPNIFRFFGDDDMPRDFYLIRSPLPLLCFGRHNEPRERNCLSHAFKGSFIQGLAEQDTDTFLI